MQMQLPARSEMEHILQYCLSGIDSEESASQAVASVFAVTELCRVQAKTTAAVTPALAFMLDYRH
jgi:hypothetical protein